MTNKQALIDLLQRLPDDASIATLRYESDLILSILESQEDVEAGRVYSHAEVMEEMRQCISKYDGQAVPASK